MKIKFTLLPPLFMYWHYHNIVLCVVIIDYHHAKTDCIRMSASGTSCHEYQAVGRLVLAIVNAIMLGLPKYANQDGDNRTKIRKIGKK